MMVAVLAVQLLSTAPPSAAVSYLEVPPTVVSTSVYALDDERAPVRARFDVVREGGGRVVVTAASGRRCLVVLERQDGAYLVDGPFWWPPGPVARVLDTRWRRSVAIAASESAGDITSLSWVSAVPELGGEWPRCFTVTAGGFTCWGVAVGEAGVVVGQAMNRIWWATVSDGSPVDLRASRWGRLMRVQDATGEASGLKVRFAHPVAQSTQRPRGLRLATAPTAAQAVTIAAGVAWLWGDELPSEAWVEVRTARAGPVYLAMADIAGGPAALLLTEHLPDTKPLDGRVTSGRDQPAAVALVSLFRLIDPPSSALSRKEKPPRRVLVAETTTDASGRFHIEGTGEAVYELVAWHSLLGRASLVLTHPPDEVIVRLQSPGTVRGRVLLAGKPLAGVEVTSVPAPDVYRDAEDLIDLKGGDARTRSDGRFAVMAASNGGGELRLGGGALPVKRIPLPKAPAPLLDLGDIELGLPIDFTIVLDQDTPCGVRATGPVGQTGLQIVLANRIAPGLFRLALPEAGMWAFGIVCGREGYALNPATLRITAAHAGTEVRFALR